MKLDKNSYGTILAAWIICGLLFVGLCLLTATPWVRILTGAILLVVAFLCTFFFRVPDRSGPGNGRIVTSVADGEVVLIDKSFEHEFLKRECIRISIYMDFFNVHANYWPVSGEVVYCNYHPGHHKLAFLPKSSELNEHATTVIRSEAGPEVLFKQIAGTFARRVVSYSKIGLPVKAGEQCGIIKLGSRIDFFLPLEAKVVVEEGQIVRAVSTIIAEL